MLLLGILANIIHLINVARSSSSSCLDYSLAMACISTVASLVPPVPLEFTFYFFSLDLALSVCWIVCFALLGDASWVREVWKKYAAHFFNSRPARLLVHQLSTAIIGVGIGDARNCESSLLLASSSRFSGWEVVS